MIPQITRTAQTHAAAICGSAWIFSTALSLRMAAPKQTNIDPTRIESSQASLLPALVLRTPFAATLSRDKLSSKLSLDLIGIRSRHEGFVEFLNHTNGACHASLPLLQAHG